MSGRACARCHGRMRQDLRHVHELDAGTLVRFPHRSTPDVVLRIGHGMAQVAPAKAADDEVSFTTVLGVPVRFEVTSSGKRIVSPSSEVLELEGSS